MPKPFEPVSSTSYHWRLDFPGALLSEQRVVESPTERLATGQADADVRREWGIYEIGTEGQ